MGLRTREMGGEGYKGEITREKHGGEKTRRWGNKKLAVNKKTYYGCEKSQPHTGHNTRQALG